MKLYPDITDQTASSRSGIGCEKVLFPSLEENFVGKDELKIEIPD